MGVGIITTRLHSRSLKSTLNTGGDNHYPVPLITRKLGMIIKMNVEYGSGIISRFKISTRP
jgi:hypothetical protein